MFKQEVKIKKASIKDVCTGGKQLLVKGDYGIDGVGMFASGTLVFCGFRGVKVGKDAWGGAYHFDTTGSKTPGRSITPAQLNSALVSAKKKGATTRKK